MYLVDVRKLLMKITCETRLTFKRITLSICQRCIEILVVSNIEMFWSSKI